ncbi:hypothetical protein PHMEG_00039282, partial [Phytophthora megakarya]
MVEWLEVSSNYKIIVGESTSGKGVSHGVGITKIEGFKRMAAAVNRATISSMKKAGVYDATLAEPWTAQVCQSRWKSYFSRYRNTRDKLLLQTGFGITDEMYALGYTLRDAVEKACPHYYRLNNICGEQSNVEPNSHTTAPVSEESGDDNDDADSWDFGLDASLPDNEDVSASTDEEAAPARSNATPPSLEFSIPNGLSETDLAAAIVDTSSPTTSVQAAVSPVTSSTQPAAASTTTRVEAASSRRNTSSRPSLPSLASHDNPVSAQSGDARGVEKAENAKRRDFASIYTEASEKRLEFSEKRMRQDIAFKGKKLEQDDRFRRQEIEAERAR